MLKWLHRNASKKRIHKRHILTPHTAELPTYAKEDDLVRCMEIVRDELAKANVAVSAENLQKITVDIMRISSSTGGDYSDQIIRRYAETYVQRQMYGKFFGEPPTTVINTSNGELIFDNFRLIPHMSLAAFEESFPQDEILTRDIHETPVYGEVTALYLKPQKRGKEYFTFWLHFSEREAGLFHLTLSVQDDSSVPTWENWSEEQQLMKKRRNDSWLERELGNPPYQFRWGCLRSVYDQREGSSCIAVNYKDR